MSTVLNQFLADAKSSQQIWALIDTSCDEWVVVDSDIYEDTDVMPLWSTEEKARSCCVEQWQNYSPAVISLSDWFEFWIDDLNSDGVCVGINWQDDSNEEMDLAEFSQALAEVESLS